VPVPKVQASEWGVKMGGINVLSLVEGFRVSCTGSDVARLSPVVLPFLLGLSLVGEIVVKELSPGSLFSCPRGLAVSGERGQIMPRPYGW
jgi:hypothetical protein